MSEFIFLLSKLTLILAFVVAVFLGWRAAKEEDFDLERFFDVIFISSCFALLVGRLIGLINGNSLVANWLAFFYFQNNPGFSINGALVGGLVSFLIVNFKLKLDSWRFLDILTVGLAAFQLILTISLLLAGSLKLQNTWSWLIVIFAFLILFVMIRIRKRVHFSGFAILTFLSLESLFMLGLEVFSRNGVYFNLKNNWFWLSVFFLSVVISYFRAKRKLVDDLIAFGNYLIELSNWSLYFIRSKRAKKRVLVKVGKYFNNQFFELKKSILSVKV